jgi:hypothetical protein
MYKYRVLEGLYEGNDYSKPKMRRLVNYDKDTGKPVITHRAMYNENGEQIYESHVYDAKDPNNNTFEDPRFLMFTNSRGMRPKIELLADPDGNCSEVSEIQQRIAELQSKLAQKLGQPGNVAQSPAAVAGVTNAQISNPNAGEKPVNKDKLFTDQFGRPVAPGDITELEDLKNMTIKELKARAAEQEIDLGNAQTKEQIVTVLTNAYLELATAPA